MSVTPRHRWSIWMVGVVCLAVVARLPRLVNRWDEVALAYAAYAAPASEAFEAGRFADAAASWVGLHPPLHAAILAVLDEIWPAPGLWMLVSVACSVWAVVVVGRHGGVLAALVLATAPLQLHDAAEVNNYALAVLGVALLWAGARATRGWFWVGVGLASWGHVLGLVTAGVVTVSRLWRPVRTGERWAIAIGAVAMAAPLVAGVLRLSLQSSTFAQPEHDLMAWSALVFHAVGWEGWVLSVLVLAGLWTRPGAHRVVWLGLACTYGIALFAGAAAPHQRPYLALFGPPAAAAVGMALKAAEDRFGRPARLLGWVVVALCLLRFGRQSVVEWRTVQRIRTDIHTTRGVDRALALTRDGDVIWLVAPALQADDDKSDHSSVLWRFVPWQAMPRHTVSHPSFSYTDWLWGQPRWMDGRQVHTSTELDPARFDVVVDEASRNAQTVVVVLYDHAPATGLLERVRRTVRIHASEEETFARDQGLGDDHLWLISTPPDGAHAHP